MYYAGETYDNGKTEPGSLKFEDIKVNWSEGIKEKFETLMILYVMSNEHTVGIHDNDTRNQNSYDVSISASDSFLRFDVVYNEKRDFVGFFCQDYPRPNKKSYYRDMFISNEEMFRLITEFGDK